MPSSLPPGLRGYVAGEEMASRRDANDLQRMGTIATMYEQARGMQEQQAVKGAFVMGPDGQIDQQATLANLYKISPMVGLKFQQALQKDTPFSKVDPKDYTPDSLAIFSRTKNYHDLKPRVKMEGVETTGPEGSPVTSFIDPYAPPGSLPKPVRKEMVNTGGTVQPVNPYSAAGPITRTASPDALMADQRSRFQWANLSPMDQQTIAHRNAGLTLDQIRTQYETGMLPGMPGGMVTAPGVPAAPAAPAARPPASGFGADIPPEMRGVDPATQIARDQQRLVTLKAERPRAADMAAIQSIDREIAQTEAAIARAQAGGNRGWSATTAPGLTPKAQGEVAKTLAVEAGKSQIKAAQDLPKTIDTATQASQQVDELLKHPGFRTAVGFTLQPGARFVDGTDAADFMARLEQLRGGAFLQAFEMLKGGGQITEVEGKKATDAITRMSKSQSEGEFVKAAREYQDVIRKGVERAKGMTGAAPVRATAGASSSWGDAGTDFSTLWKR